MTTLKSETTTKLKEIQERFLKYLKRIGKLNQAILETVELEERLDGELASFEAQADAQDETVLETIHLKRTQKNLCPSTIARLERELTTVRENLAEETSQVDSLIETLYADDHARLLDIATKAVSPWCESEGEARQVAGRLSRVVRFIGSIRRVLYAQGEVKAQLCLELVERMNKRGTLLPDDLLALLPANPETKN